MVNGISLPLATVMERGRNLQPVQMAAPQQDTFSEQLFQALQSSIERLGSGASGVEITISERQNIGGAAGSRQVVISVDRRQQASPPAAAAPPPAQQQQPAAAPTAPTQSPVREPESLPPIGRTFGSVKDLENPIPQLTALLQSMGVNTAGISFELVDDVAIGLGGPGHVNHYIRTVLPNGMKEDFSVEWTLRNPKVTAVEIAGLMRRGNSWNPLV